MSRRRICESSLRSAICAVVAAGCAGITWARPADLLLLRIAAPLEQVKHAPGDDADDDDDDPLGLGDFQWFRGDAAPDADDHDSADEDDDDLPLDDEGPVLARRDARPATA